MTQNNNIIEGTIDSVAFGGLGVMRHEGMVIFIPFANVGDRLRVRITQKKKSFAHGVIVEILEDGTGRIKPPCPYFGKCGGCQLQHLDYKSQVAAKKQYIVDAFQRIAKVPVDFPLEVVAAEPQMGYRRHIRLTLKKKDDSYIAGYIGANVSEFVQVEQCILFLEDKNPLLKEIHKLVATLRYTGMGKLTVVKADNDKLVLHFHFDKKIPKNFETAVEKIEWIQGAVATAPSQRVVVGEINLSCTVDGMTINYTPQCFVQSHAEQSDNLYSYIEEVAKTLKPKTALDLYCGIGVTSLLFARLGIETAGVEINPHSVKIANENAKINGLKASFIKGDVARSISSQKPADLIFVNPPRTGLDKSVAQAIARKRPAHILYVSCMPSTLARDIAELTKRGYKVSSARGFDMFPQTTHVETVVLLKRD